MFLLCCKIRDCGNSRTNSAAVSIDRLKSKSSTQLLSFVIKGKKLVFFFFCFQD